MKTETLFQVDAALKKFKSAARKMKSISVSKYASIEIDLTKYASGEESLECKIYQVGIAHVVKTQGDKIALKLDPNAISNSVSKNDKIRIEIKNE